MRYTIEVEYMDGKIVRFKDYTDYKLDGHNLIFNNDQATRIVPLLNVRAVCITRA